MGNEKIINKKIPSIGPCITQLDIDSVTEAMTMGWYENMSFHTDKFLNEFKNYTGAQYLLPLSHCSAALHLAFIALDLKPTDEVIVPNITWVASASPALHVGAKLTFVDIKEDTWCMDPDSFERAITKNTRAVIPVGLFGNMPDMKRIREIADKHKIIIIEDAAESIGATYDGKPAGTLGDINCFSFNATKLLCAGQGGLLTTNNLEFFEKAKLYGHHGINKKENERYYWSHVAGFNYNWTNMQAALALSQFKQMDKFLKIKHQIFLWYHTRLKDLPFIKLNQQEQNSTSSYWLICAMIFDRPELHKEYIQNKMKDFNIDVRPFFYPLSDMEPFEKFASKNIKNELPVTFKISNYGICLPCAMNITEDQVDYVCEKLKKVLGV